MARPNRSRKTNSTHENSPRRPARAPTRHQPRHDRAMEARASAHPHSDPLLKDHRVAIGNHAIAEALLINSDNIKGAWIKQGWESSSDLRELTDKLKALRVKIDIKAESILDRFGGHQGAALFLKSAPALDVSSLTALSTACLLVLDGIEDPHNLGAIVRTSWLMGVGGIFIPKDRSVGLSPGVHKVACGGVEHVPVEICSNFSQPLEELKKQGFWVFGLSHKSKKSLFDLKLPEKMVWAVGAEDKGLRITTERLCDELVSIPQLSASASYNASVATAIALTETFRQHRQR